MSILNFKNIPENDPDFCAKNSNGLPASHKAIKFFHVFKLPTLKYSFTP